MRKNMNGHGAAGRHAGLPLQKGRGRRLVPAGALLAALLLGLLLAPVAARAGAEGEEGRHMGLPHQQGGEEEGGPLGLPPQQGGEEEGGHPGLPLQPTLAADTALARQLPVKVRSVQRRPQATTVIVEIPAGADTTVASGTPDTNYGSAEDMRIGYSQAAGLGALRILIFFDVLAHVPLNAQINEAHVEAYETGFTPNGDAPMGAIYRHINSGWDPTTVTWNKNQPDWGSVRGEGEIAAQVGWGQADITELVKEWVNGTRLNYGAIYIGDETPQERQRIFYTINALNGLYPRLVVNYTVSSDNTAPVVSVELLPAWSQADFSVAWSGHDPGGSGIDYYDVQYQIPGELVWTDWLSHVSQTSAEFKGALDGRRYEFRARGVDKAGNVQSWSASAQAETRVDAIAPAATVNPLPEFTLTPSFTVSWTGTDNAGGSGIAFYDIQVQADEAAWQDWQIGTTNLSAMFTGAQDGVTYGFRARAIDHAGNDQASNSTPQASTQVNASAPVATVRPFSPTITAGDSFLVEWVGQSAPSTTIAWYEVQYQFQGGSWTTWLAQTTHNDETFFVPAMMADGVYGFEARAADSAGQEEAFSDVPEATIIVDRFEPFVEPRAYLPLVVK